MNCRCFFNEISTRERHLFRNHSRRRSVARATTRRTHGPHLNRHTPSRSGARCGMQAALSPVGLPALAARGSSRRGRPARGARVAPRAAAGSKKPPPASREDDGLAYGNSWYESTKRLSKRKSTADTLGASARGARCPCCSATLRCARARPSDARARRPAAATELRCRVALPQRSTGSPTTGCGARHAPAWSLAPRLADARRAGQQRQRAQRPVQRQLGR